MTTVDPNIRGNDDEKTPVEEAPDLSLFITVNRPVPDDKAWVRWMDAEDGDDL